MLRLKIFGAIGDDIISTVGKVDMPIRLSLASYSYLA